MSKSVIK